MKFCLLLALLVPAVLGKSTPFSEIPGLVYRDDVPGFVDDNDNFRALGYTYDPEFEQGFQKFEEEIKDLVEKWKGKLPAQYDAREAGLITPAKNQGGCGSCAAFAANACLETCMVKAYKKENGTDLHFDLSEQSLMDCGFHNGNGLNGCGGGGSAYFDFFANKFGGESAHEFNNPYKAKCDERCDPIDAKKFSTGAKVVGYLGTYSCNEEILRSMVMEYGAAMVGIAATRDFVGYKKGTVFDSDICKPWARNHAVTIVGYGTTEDGMDFWIGKNSWGRGWGDKGFFMIKRGVNKCGIEHDCWSAKCEVTDKPQDDVPPIPPV